MQVFGSIKDEGGDFYFETRVDSERNCTNSENYFFRIRGFLFILMGLFLNYQKRLMSSLMDMMQLKKRLLIFTP